MHFESQDTGVTGPELTLDLVLERLQFVVGSLKLGLLQLEQVVDFQHIPPQHLSRKNVEEGRIIACVIFGIYYGFDLYRGM